MPPQTGKKNKKKELYKTSRTNLFIPPIKKVIILSSDSLAACLSDEAVNVGRRFTFCKIFILGQVSAHWDISCWQHACKYPQSSTQWYSNAVCGLHACHAKGLFDRFTFANGASTWLLISPIPIIKQAARP